MPGLFDNPYKEDFIQAGQQYGVDPNLLMAMAYTESGLNPNAVSPAGAKGISQFMPGTAAQYGLQDPFNPQQSIDAQARYVRDLISQVGPQNAIPAYNAGPGAVKKYGGVPPYKETQNYVKKVNEYLNQLTQNEQSEPTLLSNLKGGQPSAGVDFSEFTRPADKKMSGAEKAAAILGALGSLGGMVASTAAPFKGVSGDPGAQAIKSGTSLLESLIGSQKENKTAQNFFDAVLQSNIPNDQKKNVLSFAQLGMAKQAEKVFNDALSTQNNIEQVIATNTDPRILASKKLTDETKRRAEMEDFKSKELYKKELEQSTQNKDLEELGVLMAKGDNLTPAEKATRLSLEGKYKIKSGEDSPSAIVAKTKLLGDLQKEIEPVQTVLLNLSRVKKALEKIPSDRVGGGAAIAASYLKDNPAITEYESAISEMKSLKSRLAGQTGVLTDKDVEMMLQTFPQIMSSKQSRENSFKGLISNIDNKIKNYKKLLEVRPYGKDYVSLYDELTDVKDWKSYLKEANGYTNTQFKQNNGITDPVLLDLMNNKGAKSLKVVP